MSAVHSWPFSYHLHDAESVLGEEVSALLNDSGFLPASDENARITITLGSSECTPAGISSEPLLEWRGLSVREQAQQLSFMYQAWKMDVDVAKLRIRCSGPDPDPADHLSFRETFLLNAFLFLLHRLGYFELHAAACANRSAGYLLLGPSGSGKTTALLSLIASGWSYLSDDAVVVTRAPEGKILAHAIRRSFSLRDDCVGRYPEIAPYAREPVFGTEKRRLDPLRIWPERAAPEIHPEFIVVCKITNEENSRVVPISRAESLARLVGSTPWLMLDRATASVHLELFRELAATCFGFEWRAGRDVRSNGERVAQLLIPEKLMEQWGCTDG